MSLIARLIGSTINTGHNTSDIPPYRNVDSETFSTITHDDTSYTGYYRVGGFDFSIIPQNAEVISFRALLKMSARKSVSPGIRPFYSGSSALDVNQVQLNLNADIQVFEYPTTGLSWSDFSSYGSNLYVNVPVDSDNLIYLYGVEIEVVYDLPVNKVVYGTTVLVDLTADTVTPETLLQGYTAHDKSGALITGAADTTEGSVYQDGDGYLVVDDSESSAPQGNLSITENGTYDVADYAGATVSIGSTSWTLLNSVDVQYSTVSSTSSVVTSLVTSEPYDPTRILWISVRDTQGKRTGYYYGSDCIYLANAPSSSSTAQYCLIRSVGTSNGLWQSTSSDAYGGIYPISPTLSDNRGMVIPIRGKYNTTYQTGTIDSTYRISAYYVDYPSELAPIGAGL